MKSFIAVGNYSKDKHCNITTRFKPNNDCEESDHASISSSSEIIRQDLPKTDLKVEETKNVKGRRSKLKEAKCKEIIKLKNNKNNSGGNTRKVKWRHNEHLT